VACGDDGIASFDRIRYRRHDGGVFLYAFDLIELDGADLRRDPLAVRKATLASLLARAAPGLRFNEHLDEADGPLVFAHACATSSLLLHRCAVPTRWRIHGPGEFIADDPAALHHKLRTLQLGDVR
jgi:hypothetical protein